MGNRFYKLAGYCLLTGCLLMVVTMVLHPVGGNLHRIISVSTIAIVSHAIAVLSIPFTAFGFYGLSKKLQTSSRLSFLALSFAGFALIAVMLAAILNGLLLPMYLLKHTDILDTQSQTLNLVSSYGVTFNAALDYVFISGYTIAMLIWSYIAVQIGLLPKWFGWLGIITVAVTLAAALLQLNFISVPGFTMYVLGIVIWLNAAAILLIRQKK